MTILVYHKGVEKGKQEIYREMFQTGEVDIKGKKYLIIPKITVREKTDDDRKINRSGNDVSETHIGVSGPSSSCDGTI